MVENLTKVLRRDKRKGGWQAVLSKLAQEADSSPSATPVKAKPAVPPQMVQGQQQQQQQQQVDPTQYLAMTQQVLQQAQAQLFAAQEAHQMAQLQYSQAHGHVMYSTQQSFCATPVGAQQQPSGQWQSTDAPWHWNKASHQNMATPPPPQQSTAAPPQSPPPVDAGGAPGEVTELMLDPQTGKVIRVVDFLQSRSHQQP